MLTETQHELTSWDGTRLFYRAWLPERPAAQALILFHRGHEHSGRFEGFVRELALTDTAVFAWDARGNGRSDGPKDHADHFTDYEKDMDVFVRSIAEKHQIAYSQISVLGHSVGAVIVAAWVHDFAPPIRAMVLVTPAFRIRLYLPLAIPLLRIARSLGVMKTVPSYVKANVLMHDEEQRRLYNADRTISHAISTHILLDLHDTATRIVEDAAAISVPTLLLTAGSDWVVETGIQDTFFKRLGAGKKSREFYPGFFHDILHEKNREGAVSKIRQFIQDAYAAPPAAPITSSSPSHNFTHEEHARLKQPLPFASPKKWGYVIVRNALRSLGLLSQGIRLGWESGFNSGRTLDYVYENQAQGHTPLGRFIDKAYLDGAGWQGIRIRRSQLENILKRTIENAHQRWKTVHLVDIAAGAGRYLLETLKKFDAASITAELRDMEPKNLEHGRRRAEALGLRNVRFVPGDAFDRSALAGLTPAPQIALVSGLYELFADNAKVSASLQGLADAIPPGGFLIYTNQPWHPQMEFIARTLSDWDGKPWVMRRRTQAEMDALVRAAGFEKLNMDIDPAGIFTVSVARRLETR